VKTLPPKKPTHSRRRRPRRRAFLWIGTDPAHVLTECATMLDAASELTRAALDRLRGYALDHARFLQEQRGVR
jgi:hypothetical protein